MTFGAKLRELRESAGLSLADLALEAKVSPSYITYIERGVRKPPALTLIRRLERALEAPGALEPLSGRIPPDLAEALTNPAVQSAFRLFLHKNFPELLPR